MGKQGKELYISFHSDFWIDIIAFLWPRKLKLRRVTCSLDVSSQSRVGIQRQVCCTPKPVLFMLFSTGDISSLAKSTLPCLWMDFRTIWCVFQSHTCQFHLQESLPDVSWNMFHHCWWSFFSGVGLGHSDHCYTQQLIAPVLSPHFPVLQDVWSWRYECHPWPGAQFPACLLPDV